MASNDMISFFTPFLEKNQNVRSLRASRRLIWDVM